MKVSRNWLNSIIDVSRLSIVELGDILTSLGLEVEGGEEYSTIKGGLEGVLIGRVETCESHPNADRLQVTTVDVGKEEKLQIVCGAPNVRAGQTVVVATVGAVLYSAKEQFKIKKTKIRNVISEGMLCAEDELGLGISHEGIIVIEDDVKPGVFASDYYKIEVDYVYEVGLTPNRSDATHHLGIAKDVAAYLTYHNRGKVVPQIDFPSIPKPKNKINFSLDIVSNKLAPRYAGVVIDNVRIVDSPDWMQARLKALGIKPKNIIVDTTNYIMHEMGQPLHAFDISKISGNEIKVKQLPSGTKFRTLDDVEIQLNGEEIMICDKNDTPLCMGGVFGGLESGVRNMTKKIFLESAHFDPTLVRKASMRHQLRTEAAKIFEKGSDPSIVINALKRAVFFITKYAAGKVVSDTFDIYPQHILPKKIAVRFNKVRQVIGVEISNEEIIKILDSLGINIVSQKLKSITVSIPTDKTDVTREIDVIEEILRVYGFDSVNTHATSSSIMNPIQMPQKQGLIQGLKSRLIGLGFSEMMNISLTSSEYFKNEDRLIYIMNTSNKGLNVLRPSMMTSALKTAEYNLNRNQSNLKLFEIGKTYGIHLGKYKERNYISLMMHGEKYETGWTQPDSTVLSIYDLKGYVHLILQMMNVTSYQTTEIQADNGFKVGMKYFRGNQIVTQFGVVDPEVAQKHGVKSSILYAEINLDLIISNAMKGINYYFPINKYPSIQKDISLLVTPECEHSWEAIESIIKKASTSDLKVVKLLSIFEDKNILGEGNKSLSVQMEFANNDSTLTDKYVNKQIDNIIAALQKDLGIELR